MLGLQDSRAGGTLPTRTYRCVACSAMFPGLSSLLVHQASHANDGNSLERLQPPLCSTQPSCSHCGVMFASQELLKKHLCNASAFPSSSSAFTCDCGKEFQDFSAMLEHKKSHAQDPHPQHRAAGEANTWEASGAVSSLSGKTNLSPSQGFSPICSSHPVPSNLHLIPQLASTMTSTEVGTKEIFSVPTALASQFNNGPLVQGQLTSIPVSQPTGLAPLPILTTQQDKSIHTGVQAVPAFPPSADQTCSSRDPRHQPELKPPKKKTLKKMLFSEFMKRLPPAQLAWKSNKEVESSKNMMNIAAASAAAAAATPSPGASISQLRRLLAKSGTKKKSTSQACAILNIIKSNKHSLKTVSGIVSLTKTFLPIVALETRQKLAGIGKDGLEGRHQCGRCRRIFQDVDSLILHHVTHRKERVNGCQRCGHLLISRVPISENHICSMTSTQSAQDMFSVGTVLYSPSGTHAHLRQEATMPGPPYTTLQRSSSTLTTRKRFHCYLCNHNYSRLYSLKTHKCQGLSTLLQANSTHKIDGFPSIEGVMTVGGELKMTKKHNEVMEDEGSQLQNSVAVGTEDPYRIKLEMSEEGPVSAGDIPYSSQARSPPSELDLWSRSPKNFIPFFSKSVKCTPFQKPGSETKGETGVSPVLQDTVGEGKKEREIASESARREEKGLWTVPIDDAEVDLLIKAVGDKDDLTEPLTVDSVESTINQNSSEKHAFLAGKKGFVCSQCGRSYTRRFTLHQHQRKCYVAVKGQMQQNIRKTLKINKDWAAKLRFDCFLCKKSFSRRDTLLLHKMKCQGKNSRGDENDDHSGTENRNVPLEHVQNKGRMFVLPPTPDGKGNRKGNNNQGTGGDWGIMSLPSVLPRTVTCECGAGFTCPRLLFEHLQMHAQETYICPDCGETLQSWPAFESHLRTHQRFACPKCNKTFSLHSSLVRHLRKNHCPVDATREKKHCCSQCNLVLPNALSLKLHMQNPICKPSNNLIHCPVCTRAFSSVEGLQRHLLTHSHPSAFRCHLCQRSYPSIRGLKDHRRKVHRM